MTDYKVLVPFNLAVDDDRSLDVVTRLFLNKENAVTTLFFACNPVPDLDVRKNPYMERMAQNLAYRRQLLRDQESSLEDVKNRLVERGFPHGRVKTLFRPLKKGVAQDIIFLVRDKGFHAVVLTRNPGNLAGFFTRSVSARVAKNLSPEVQLYFVN